MTLHKTCGIRAHSLYGAAEVYDGPWDRATSLDEKYELSVLHFVLHFEIAEKNFRQLRQLGILKWNIKKFKYTWKEHKSGFTMIKVEDFWFSSRSLLRYSSFFFQEDEGRSQWCWKHRQSTAVDCYNENGTGWSPIEEFPCRKCRYKYNNGTGSFARLNFIFFLNVQTFL